MGCTLITVSSLPVLILASIAANMEVITEILTLQNKEIRTISTISLKNNYSSDPEIGVTDAYGNNVKEKNNDTLLEKYNCTDFKMDQKNCSYDITTFTSMNLVENVTKAIVTYRDFKEYKYYQNVIRILPFVPNIPGIVTNSLTIIIASKIKPLCTSELYMIALGSADFITVSTRCTYYVWSTYTDEKSAVSCKVPGYIIHLALIFSNMTLMAWTIERFIAVIFPIKLATLCSLRNTKFTLIFILLVCLLLAIPYFTEYDVYTFTNGKITVSACYEKDFMISIWTHIESFYYIYIPMVCVCGCNIAILYRLSVMAKSRMSMTSNQETIDKKTSENRRMTILLLTISGCFIVLHIPYAIILVLTYIYPDISILAKEDPEFFAKYLFYTTLGFLITDFQNSVNFFLYCISGNKFRATFSKLFCKGIMKTNRTQELQSSATRSTKF